MLNSMLHFIKKSPDCFHAVQTLAQMLEGEGYVRLEEGGWELKQGGMYYTVRNGSSLLAFRDTKRVLADGFSFRFAMPSPA